MPSMELTPMINGMNTELSNKGDGLFIATERERGIAFSHSLNDRRFDDEVRPAGAQVSRAFLIAATGFFTVTCL